MTTSGITQYSKTRDEIIRLAAGHIQVRATGAGRSQPDDDEQKMAELLNGVVKKLAKRWASFI